MDPNLKTQIIESSATSEVPDLSTLKAMHRKMYLKKYQKDFRKTTKRIEIILNFEEFAKVSKLPLGKEKLGTFIKRVFFSNLENVPVMTHDQREIFRLFQIEVIRIGTLINQIAKKVNTTGILTKEEYEALHQLLSEVEVKAEKYLGSPVSKSLTKKNDY